MRILNLNILQNGLPGITPVIGAFYMEAAIVSLMKKGFQSGVKLKIDGAFTEIFILEWETNLTPLQLNSWKEENHYHSAGAVALSLLLIKELLGFTIFEEGTIGTGIDYWLGKEEKIDEFNPFFKKLARLEISGIGKATSKNSVNMRINKKKKQIAQSDSTKLEGWISVVEFSTPKTKIIKK